jgi:uncharacterized protein YjbI with pentapeptide repeats
VEQDKESRWGFRDKTVWNWLELLVVPLALAGIGILFTWQQDVRQQQIEDQRAQDVALQAYLDQMSTLLLEKGLRNSEQDSEVRTLARARTLTVLGRLDPIRKAEVMSFLVEADLVQEVDGKDPVIDLSRADLSGVILGGDAHLSGANLSGARLTDAYLASAYLGGADLSGANLRGVSLRDARLGGADLGFADLAFADLGFAHLEGADLRWANLSGANLSDATGVTKEQLEQEALSLEGATMPDGSKHP